MLRTFYGKALTTNHDKLQDAKDISVRVEMWLYVLTIYHSTPFLVVSVEERSRSWHWKQKKQATHLHQLQTIECIQMVRAYGVFSSRKKR